MARTAKEKPAAQVVEKTPVKRKKTTKAEPTESVVIQYAGSEWDSAELIAQVKAAYVAQGHYAASIKELFLYVKPEEMKVYYVINGRSKGAIDL